MYKSLPTSFSGNIEIIAINSDKFEIWKELVLVRVRLEEMSDEPAKGNYLVCRYLEEELQ